MKLKPRIVAALGYKAVEESPRVKALGADMVEIRMDLVKGDPLEAMGTAACRSGLPVIRYQQDEVRGRSLCRE